MEHLENYGGINLEIVTMKTPLPLPSNALYRKKEDARETFELFDHPKGFYRLSREEQGILLDWCKCLTKIKSINIRHSSYSLKHLFEYSQGGFYITNGQFKGAMILAEFHVDDKWELNWQFNVAEKSIKVLEEACRIYRENS